MVSYFCLGRVLAITDGDTVMVETDLGRGIFLPRDRLRLHGINAPEKGQAGYFSAKAYLETLLEVGKKYRIETMKTPEKYGRYLAIIHLEDGRKINDLMVEAGHAVRYMV